MVCKGASKDFLAAASLSLLTSVRMTSGLRGAAEEGEGGETAKGEVDSPFSTSSSSCQKGHGKFSSTELV